MNVQLPEIPRLVTALAEWSCCVICLGSVKRRFPKPATIVLIILGMFGQISLQYLAGGMPAKFWILGMIMNVAYMLCFLLLLGEIRGLQGIYWTSLAFVGAEFLAAFEWHISCSIFPDIQPKFHLGATIIGVVFFTVFLCFFYYMEQKTKRINDLIRHRHALTALFLTIIAFVISNVAFLNTQWRSTISEQYYVYFIRSLVDFCVLVIMYLQQWTMQEQQYMEELSSIQNVLNLQYKQYLDYKESSEYISRQCHDLKHQIEALRGACSNEEREEYLKGMEEAINRYNGQNVTGNAVLDTLLTKKKIYCLDHGIDFSMTANGKALSFLAVRDICTIVGNLLDNAIEYVSGLENEEERQIQGEIYEKGSFLLIRIENYYRGKALKDNHLPKTTKVDAKRHGYGLKSVRYIAEKYEGSMTIRTENQWFVVRVLIPLPKE